MAIIQVRDKGRARSFRDADEQRSSIRPYLDWVRKETNPRKSAVVLHFDAEIVVLGCRSYSVGALGGAARR